MTVRVRPVATGSMELCHLLERTEQAAVAAGRSDLVDRIGTARQWMDARPLRVGVTAGAGSEALVRMLRGVTGRWLPGASYVDAPGQPGSGRTPPGFVDLVLVVADAGHEYGRDELETVAQVRDQGTPVVGVLVDYDVCPDLAAVLEADRRLLRAAGLDSPPIPLLPVSAAMCESGWRRGDEGSVVTSGVPQLLEFLRDQVDTGVDSRRREAVLGEVRAVVDQLLPARNDELARLRARTVSPEERRKQAMTTLEQCRQRSAAWQLALNDGATEMNAALDFDLRERLRDVVSFADGQITTADPFADWAGFDAAIQSKIDVAATADHQVMQERSRALSRTVAARLAGNADGSFTGVPLPRVVIGDPGEGLAKLTASDAPQAGGGLFSRLVNSVRGSYGGILMVGVLTSLAGEKLISVYSVGAGVLLGLFTFFEDRKTTRERRKAEGRAAVAKRLDEANFRLGDHQRVQLRAVHRALRDHFTVVNDDRLRAASDAVRAAADGREDDGERLTVLEAEVAELTDLRDRTAADVTTARS